MKQNAVSHFHNYYDVQMNLLLKISHSFANASWSVHIWQNNVEMSPKTMLVNAVISLVATHLSHTIKSC